MGVGDWEVGRISKFQDLTVWKKSHRLALEVYGVTRCFPKEEMFGLVAQMRRAAVSVPANVAEGFKKRGKKDKIRFYNLAQGSLSELKYYLILSEDLGYHENLCDVRRLTDEVGKMLNRLISSVADFTQVHDLKPNT